MNISYNWLKAYFEADTTIDEVLEVLTQTGLEVEGCTQLGIDESQLEGLLVGEVLSKEKHPNADRLSLTRVDVGNGEPLPIVCGAPNVEAGQKVVVATVGSTLYPQGGDPFKIKRSKIRGEESMGMICAEDEIGVGTSHDGIMVLDADAQVGNAIAAYINTEKDYQIEIGLTPNRTDAMSHMGVARDLVAGLLRTKEASVNLPPVDAFKVDNTALPIEIEVRDVDACPRYAGATISGIKVGESPEWLQAKLRAIGLQPINNVVDVTNYVLHECGQPLHAFDFDQIAGGKIVVQRANSGGKFKTLDDVERTLDANDLMICDAEKPMCIAGVFGGLHSGVSETTTRIFLESAFFDPVAVRKTAKRHGLNTDASFRFERGVDPELTIYALKRAAMLLKEICGAEVSSEIYDIYPAPIGRHEVQFDLAACNRLIGQDVPQSDVESILDSLEIEVLNKDGNNWKLSVPAYRHDVTRHVDVCEEVLRIYGYNQVSEPSQLRSSLSYSPTIDREQAQRKITTLLVSKGYSEIMANSLISSGDTSKSNISALGDANQVVIENPLSSELDVLRTSMVFGGLHALAHNANRQRHDLRLFEFGKIYSKGEQGYDEEHQLTLFATGRKSPESWQNSSDRADYYGLKGLVDRILDKLGLHYAIQESRNELFSGATGYVVDGQLLAECGTLNPSMCSSFDVDQEVFYAEIHWDLLLKLYSEVKIEFSEVPRFPEVRRDFSLLIGNEVEFKSIRDIAFKCEQKLLKSVNLFDVYEGKNLPAGKKSYAVSFILQDTEKTLEDKLIDSIMAKIQKALEKELDASLR